MECSKGPWRSKAGHKLVVVNMMANRSTLSVLLYECRTLRLERPTIDCSVSAFPRVLWEYKQTC
ncbi:hypothetical protein K491DRAFT_694599 [Lophiostoma macrostomum CBS 122681]|uniref:Uncharacterized protein n=1 Tax=Lophiostoma macrostomum CBS 122681 TaxID=1314788 RepID=A0A6A6T3S1_9PLEO|nr:hypothetical protein K491DRAFT_694599 [Lophiostoma macrostomum CBS 122681]